MNVQEVRQKYPQYSDLSDDELGKALHAKFYADMPYDQFAQKAGFASAPKQPERQSNTLGRQIGLTARHAIEGVAGIPNAIADPLVGLVNRMGANLPIPSEALGRTLTRAGLPEPQDGAEKFVGAVNRGMVAPAALAKALPQFGAHIGTQIAASGSGAGSANLAEQGGFGPLGQTVAGVAGGVFAPVAGIAATRGAQSLAHGSKALVEPFTKEGQRTIAARAYQGAASDKQAAVEAMNAAPEYVPNSKPTSAQASGDAGLASMEKTLRNRFPQAFADRDAQQNTARMSGLERAFGDAPSLRAAEELRDEITGPLREAAFADAKKVNTKPIINTANTITRSQAGGRQEVERAMAWVKSRVEDVGSDAGRVYALRQDINDIIAGKMRDPEKASYQLAAGQLKAIKAVLDNQLEKAAPGFQNYLREYRDRSTAIRPMKLGQEITADATNNYRETLSGPKFANIMANRADEVGQSGAIASDVLSRVNADLKRAGAPMGAMRTPGSDTSQNLIAQNILQSTLGGSGDNGAIQRIVSKGLGWLFTAPEEQIQKLLLQGALDPETAAVLLAHRVPKRPDPRAGLLGSSGSATIGGLLGINAE